jgi:hypothetical protein
VGFSAIAAAVEELLTRSPTLSTSLAVLEPSRHPMAPSRRRLFSIMRSSDDPLLDAVRTRLTSGALFPFDRASWTGRGSGKSCAVCDLAINNAEIEYEVAGGLIGSGFAHLRCYLVWRQESEALRWSEGRR